jgi:sporulation protein YlmC with PRC-barrel domain
MPISENDLSGVYDGDVVSASGEKIGSVGQIYLDDQTGEPSFVTANTGLFGMSQSFVPLRGARVENGNVVVDFDKTTVKDAPRIDDDGSLSPSEEDQLYAYYGMSTANADNADYGTADQTPEPGYAQAGAGDRTWWRVTPGSVTVPTMSVAVMSAPTRPGPGRTSGPIWGRMAPGWVTVPTMSVPPLWRPTRSAATSRASRKPASTPVGAPTSAARPTTTRPRRMHRPLIATRTRWAGMTTARQIGHRQISRRQPEAAGCANG